VGGLETYARDLHEDMLRLGLARQITVLSSRLPATARAFQPLGPGHTVARYPAFEAIPNFPCPAPWRRGFAHAVKPALDGGYDAVVCHTRFFLSSLAALLHSRARRLPLVHVEHGSDYVHLSSPLSGALARGYDRTFGRLVLRRAQAVVAVSQAAAGFVDELAGRSAEVIYRGVDRARYDAVEPSASLLEWAAGRPLALFAGRLIDGKGVADLIEAFAALEDRSAALCLVGDGPRRGELEALGAARGLDGRCLFAGYLPEDEALAAIRAADVLVNPSYTEGLPTAVLEAALLGRAVLASDVGGTAEVTADGRGAVLTAPGDVAALRYGLAGLLADPQLRERLGAAARADAMRRFDGDASARAFARAVRQLACRDRV
jgi:glycosyltransferase involved in cell wall biosynthesis